MTISIQKSIYDPKSREDGYRVLVMQYWPRGVKKDKVDVWFRELGTSKELIKAWKTGKVSWPEFKRRYTADLKQDGKRDLIRELTKRARTEKITLLCGCHDANRCHRIILKEQIEHLKPIQS